MPQSLRALCLYIPHWGFNIFWAVTQKSFSKLVTPHKTAGILIVQVCSFQNMVPHLAFLFQPKSHQQQWELALLLRQKPKAFEKQFHTS